MTEAGGVNNGTPGTPTATGTLTDTDVDNPANTFQAFVRGHGQHPATACYGRWRAGAGRYTLDNANAAVQALNVGQHLTDTFTVTTIDGTAQLVTVTINGTNDAAVITGTTSGNVTEAGGVNNGTPGTPTASGTLTDTDVDNTANTFRRSLRDGEHRRLRHLHRGRGAWTYTLDDSNAAVQALNVGGTLTDTFTVQTADGTRRWSPSPSTAPTTRR